LACGRDARTYSPIEIGAGIIEIGMLGRSGLANPEADPLGRRKSPVRGLSGADAILDPKAGTESQTVG